MNKPTPLDRMMLSNQYRILEKLYPDEAESFEELREAVESGYELIYLESLGYLQETLTEEQCVEVIDTLQLFLVMKQTAEKHEKDDWLKEQSDGIFGGYDGNNETKFMTFVEYLVERQGKFKDLIPNNYFNSHTPKRGTYQKMVAKWREIAEGRYDSLSMDEIGEILKA